MSDLGLKLQGALGILCMIALAWALSTDRRKVRWPLVLWGLFLQFLFAVIVLKTDAGRAFFDGANSVILSLLALSERGATFVFGGLGTAAGVAGYIFAFQTLSTIIFFASLMAVLYHFGVMQLIVRGVSWVMQRTLGTSGAETLSASANIFVGQTEAPLLVRPFIEKMTRSEIMTVMTGGFATVAGGVMAAYVSFLYDANPAIAGHLMAASVMAAPGGILISKLMLPETGTPQTAGTSVAGEVEVESRNVVDAAAKGAGDGLHLALNVGAMLIAFVALVALANEMLGWFGDLLWGWFGAPMMPTSGSWLSLELIFQLVFSPISYVMGIERGDVLPVAQLLGTKITQTEFLAFQKLGTMGDDISPRSFTMASYALCGFANFASIAIQIGGIGAIAPSRRSDLAEIGLRAMFAGFLTTCLTATVAGLVI